MSHEVKTEVEHAAQVEVSADVAGWAGLAEDARNATAEEHSMTITKAIKMYPKACMWSMVVSLVVIMDGYDTALMGSFFGFPTFQKQFGIPVGDGSYQLQAKWQTALGLASPLGNVFGIYINAVIAERWGHKKAALGSLVFLTGVLFVPFFSKTVVVLFIGQLLCGIAWGVFTTLAPAYASEGIGQFVSYALIYTQTQRVDEWSWRIPLAVQWAWPAIIFPPILFAPESPWWLVRHGRLTEAEKAVKRLSSRSNNYETQAKQAVALMVETTNIEKIITEGASFADCFRGSNLWRTEISCLTWTSQVLCGFAISNYAAYFYQQAGLSTSNSCKMTVGQGGIHFACNLFSLLVTKHFGRRAIALTGYTCMSLSMLLLGFLALAPQTTGLGYSQAVMFLIWYCTYQLTIGPTAFIIVGEISSTRLRSKSISLARNAYYVANIFSSTVAPCALNPTAGNLKGKTGFLAALLYLIWGYFRLPESKGRTYEELDILFSRNLKAREFKSASVDNVDVNQMAKEAS